MCVFTYVCVQVYIYTQVYTHIYEEKLGSSGNKTLPPWVLNKVIFLKVNCCVISAWSSCDMGSLGDS